MGEAKETRAAFEELVRLLGDVGEGYLTADHGITSELDVVEGYHYVTHLLSAACEFHLEGDPERPRFVRIVSPARKFLGDNPDAIYFWTPIRGDRAYRISGVRGEETYISFTVHGRDPQGGTSEPPVADINDRDLDVKPDGSYEFVLSPEKRPGKWVQLDPSAVSVITRHYFARERSAAGDPDVQVRLRIDPLEDPGPPPPRSDAETAERLRRVIGVIRANTVDRARPSDQPAVSFVSRIPNQLPEPASFRASNVQAWGAVDFFYCSGPYKLGPNEALVMEGSIPDCAMANVMLWNRHMQTLEYLHHQTSLNDRQMVLGDGGQYRIVIAHRDPGVPNWLDTEGHAEGTIFWRFVLPTAQPPQPQCTVVPVDSLATTA